MTAPMTRKELESEILLDAESYRDMARWLATQIDLDVYANLGSCDGCIYEGDDKAECRDPEYSTSTAYPCMRAQGVINAWLEGEQ